MKPSRPSLGLCIFAPSPLISSALLALDHKWPDRSPPGATGRTRPLAISPRRQPVPGHPEGLPAVSSDVFEVTSGMIATLNSGNATAGPVMPAA